MSEDEDPKGSSLGPQPPSLGGPQAPSLGGPGATSAGGPNLGGDPVESSAQLSTFIQPEKKKKGKITINRHEIVRRWGVIQRRIQRSLQTFMTREFKTNIRITSLNELYRDHVLLMMNGQIDFFNETIETIKSGDDVLSQQLMEVDLEKRASTQVFESLREIVEEEIAALEYEKPKVVDLIQDNLKTIKDKRIEPRSCFWILWSTGLQLMQIENKVPFEFEIVMDVIIRYKPVFKRLLGTFLHLCYYLVKEFDPYQKEIARSNLIPGPTGTGYNMAPWIKYRYGTNSQVYMDYIRYLNYYMRSFGKITGNAPEMHKTAYRNWLNRVFSALEEKLKTSEILVSNARGDTLEGMIVGLKDELEDELRLREYDEDGKLMNQPVGGENAVHLLEWIFESAFNRFKTTNFASHGKVRLFLDMFEFIQPSITWENEYGERIVEDWLDPEEV